MRHARVLIVDSDRRLRSQLYTRLLDVEVFSDSVSNANEALEYLRDRSYGLILLDLELPNDEAFSVMNNVRMIALAERPMILATAARDAKADIDPELVQIVMRKPLRLADVADMIRSCVGSARNVMAGSEQGSNGSIELIGGDQQIVSVVG
jgi:DNA-binding response OmpR family regulator